MNKRSQPLIGTLTVSLLLIICLIACTGARPQATSPTLTDIPSFSPEDCIHEFSTNVEIWEDVNQNSVRDDGEPPLPNIEVSFDNPMIELLGEYSTDNSGEVKVEGEIRFGPCGEAPEGYGQVSIVLPAGCKITTSQSSPRQMQMKDGYLYESFYEFGLSCNEITSPPGTLIAPPSTP